MVWVTVRGGPVASARGWRVWWVMNSLWRAWCRAGAHGLSRTAGVTATTLDQPARPSRRPGGLAVGAGPALRLRPGPARAATTTHLNDTGAIGETGRRGRPASHRSPGSSPAHHDWWVSRCGTVLPADAIARRNYPSTPRPHTSPPGSARLIRHVDRAGRGAGLGPRAGSVTSRPAKSR